MRTEIAFVLTGMQERIGQALLAAALVPVVLLGIVAFVLWADRQGWLP